jgi:hypothetical protein
MNINNNDDDSDGFSGEACCGMIVGVTLAIIGMFSLFFPLTLIGFAIIILSPLVAPKAKNT